jgi:hypothetical protein
MHLLYSLGIGKDRVFLDSKMGKPWETLQILWTLLSFWLFATDHSSSSKNNANEYN